MSFTYTTLKNALQDYTQNTETSFVSNMPLFIRLGEERIFKSVQLNLFQRNVSGGMTADNQFLTVPSDFLAPISLSVTNSSNVEFLEFKSLEYIQAYNPNPATTGTPKYYAQFDLDNFTVAPTPDTGYVTTLSYFYRPTSITSSLFQLTLNNISGTFTTSDTITGGTSGQSSSVSAIDLSLGFLDVVVAATLTATIPSGTFTVGETITGSSSGAAGTLSAIGADTTVTWLSENAEIALLYGCLLECYTYMKGEQDLISLYNSRLNEALSRLKNLGEAQEVSDEYTSGQIRKAKT
jgi:hypothetical protein|tara:strand:- start:174 stop:1055 length:882 start_codon:yes stop_codon:yes gene_type:complete